MITRHQNGKVSWYDVVSPTNEEVRKLITDCKLPPEFMVDLSVSSTHSYTEVDKSAVKLSLSWPIVKRTDIDHPHNVKFIATKTALITIRFEDMQVFDRFTKDFEVVTMLKKVSKPLTGDQLLFSLLTRLYKGLEEKLDYMTSALSDIDDEIFRGNEREMVKGIAATGRKLLTFRQTLESQENPLGVLYTEIPAVFGKDSQKEVIKINEQFLTVSRRVGRLFTSMEEMRETNNSLITTKQNEIMKTLTIMAFIALPLTLVSSIFGMNTIDTPIVGNRGDFWIIIGFMVTSFCCLFIFFWYRNWL